jgi:hypothetical protein
MASERQIEANRANSQRSCGPKTEAGKSQSRSNATRHGMASQSTEVEAGFSPEFAARRALWAAEQQPEGEAGLWALDRAVAASLRIERCERAFDSLTTTTQQRAKLTWEQDRAIDAATIFGRLSRNPILASRQLQGTLAGVLLLIEAWLGLAASLQSGGSWSESEASRALDLLGVDAGLRSGQTLIDAPEGTDLRVYRNELIFEEIERLESLRDEAMIPLDEIEQAQAIKGDAILLSNQAKLVLRYERDAWKRFRESMKEVKGQTQTSPATIVEAPSVVQTAPKNDEPASTNQARSFEEERRAILAESAPYRNEVINGLVAMGLTDEDAWLDELERRIEARSVVTERTQFADFGVGREGVLMTKTASDSVS